MGNLHKKLYIAAVLCLALALLCGCGKASEPPAPTEAPAPEQTPQATPQPTPKPTPTPAPAATPEPRAERVEDDYFADAAFFGNSLMEGLRHFGNMEFGSFFATTSASVISVETTRDCKLSTGETATMLEALLEEPHGKIYTLFGINELGFDKGGFISLYADLLDSIREAQPDAEIYVMSLTPITESRSKTGDVFTRERVQEFNEAIKTMAEEHGYGYLDLFEALSDKTGFLPEKHSSDGIHFTVDTYRDWAEYLHLNYDGAAKDVTFYKDEEPAVVVPPTPTPTPTPVPTPTPTSTPTPTPTPPPASASPSDLKAG